MNFELKTKAETLEVLKKAGFNIPDLYFFNTTEWLKAEEIILNNIKQKFSSLCDAVIIRSSSLEEDGQEASKAGAFESILNVDLNNKSELKQTIKKVISSYSGEHADQVLIQPMIKDIELSGVIMTRCLDDGSPYYVINYDDESGKTDLITGGTGVGKTIYVYKGVSRKDFDSIRVRKIIEFAQDLEKAFPYIPLDIEFGIDKDQKIHLFQVRKICSCKRWNPNVENIVSAKISFVEKFVSQLMLPKTGVYGSKSALGVMPDWNPAEIIGVTPTPLAASLYREIITRRTWSRARESMGYREMPPEELMLLIAGRPFIDVRNSFNSFLPKDTPPATAEKIINGWIERLDCNPQLHDKIEFEIATTVHDPCFEEIFSERYPTLLNKNEFSEYQKALLTLTNKNLQIEGSLHKACKQIDKLVSKQKNYPAFKHSQNIIEIISLVRQLLEDCIEYGALPFSIIARHGFIVESFLRAIVAKQGLSAKRVNEFKMSIETISGQMSTHFEKVCNGEMDKTDFLNIYGHLRPGTYDILSLRYLDRADLFSDFHLPHKTNSLHAPFALTTIEKQSITNIFKESGITAVTSESFLKYAAKAIASREYAKFVFTKNISNALEGLVRWGKLIGLNRKDISLLNISDILDSLYSQLDDNIKEHFMELSQRGAKQYELANSFKLSYLIRSPRDIYIVPQHRCTPNFITTESVEALVVKLNTMSTKNYELDGHIVCIESADPGYDWIFTRPIAGLITKYGGTNSHMAIRCAEYGLPAAIGCGEMLYDQIVASKKCILDAGLKILSPSCVGNGDLF